VKSKTKSDEKRTKELKRKSEHEKSEVREMGRPLSDTNIE